MINFKRDSVGKGRAGFKGKARRVVLCQIIREKYDEKICKEGIVYVILNVQAYDGPGEEARYVSCVSGGKTDIDLYVCMSGSQHCIQGAFGDALPEYDKGSR